MLSLIKKDLLIIKNNLKLIGVMLIIFFAIAMQDNFDITVVLPFIMSNYFFTIVIFMSTFSYDEFNKWDAYAVTLPNGRKNIVRAKYITNLILIVGALIITLVLNYFIGYINNGLDFSQVIASSLEMTIGITLVESIMFPLIFKFGIEKGRIGLFALTIALGGIATIISKKGNINIPDGIVTFFNNYYFVIIPVILIIAILLSYKISERIYSKKEF